MRRKRKNTLVELDKGTGPDEINRRLTDAGARVVKFHLCGIEITRRRPDLGCDLLAALTKQLKVRCTVERGVVSVYPRPYCNFSAHGVIVNGYLLNPELGPLDAYRRVWPELDRQLKQRFGDFICGDR